ncbi:rod shape-determining protein [Sphingobium sp. CR28]|uniref:rod shape-determining protein n=1 Tax=Sphingobium sp. CR28 TaxID=3400272 RepID=UPI003FEFC4AE
MMNVFAGKMPELAIDFGTANLRIIRRDDGVVFDEPSLCCFDTSTEVASLSAAGLDVRPMIDRTHPRLSVKRPLRRGVLQDIETATHLLRYAVRKTSGRWQAGASAAVVGVPTDATRAERSALLTAARDAGIGTVHLVDEPFAAAIGADLPVQMPRGTMIVECGAGTTEVAVISLGGICHARSVRIGGASLDQAIADHLHFKHKFLIGALTAERVKMDYALHREERPGAEMMTIKGRSITTGLPALIQISSTEIDQVVERHMALVVETVREVLLETSPELSQDILENGVVLTGGSALTPHLSEMIAAETGLSVSVASKPLGCVAAGLQRIIQN